MDFARKTEGLSNKTNNPGLPSRSPLVVLSVLISIYLRKKKKEKKKKKKKKNKKLQHIVFPCGPPP
jgi:hypothetical protein